MAKHRPSLEAMATGISPVPPSNVVAGPGARIARPRQDRPHVSLYLSKPVQRAIKQMAASHMIF